MRLSIFRRCHRHRAHVRRISRVWLSGQDVTRRCQEFDTRQGWALLLKDDGTGRPYFDKARGEVARERVHGQVRVAFKNRRHSAEVAA